MKFRGVRFFTSYRDLASRSRDKVLGVAIVDRGSIDYSELFQRTLNGRAPAIKKGKIQLFDVETESHERQDAR